MDFLRQSAAWCGENAREAGVVPIATLITVIACDKRKAFAQGSKATKQSMPQKKEEWIASLRSQ
jgi:hypothetical protein